MDTRNTTKTTSINVLERALHMIEVLSNPKGMAIVQFLLQYRQATFLELSIHTCFDSDILEYQLEQLCSMQLLHQKSSLLEGDWYEPNIEYLLRVSSVVKKLAAFHG